MRDLLKYTQRPEVISFAGGMPAPELFPLERFREAAERVLGDSAAGQTAMQYSSTEGYLPLRKLILRHTARYGIDARPENVLITTGSQQALDLIAKLFINPGDPVLVEAPTYLGALQAFDVMGARYASVPVDDHGLQTDSRHMLRAMAEHPKFMYLLPNFQNPSGVTLPLERRQEVVRLARKHGIPIVEDDPYGQLRYEGTHLPPLLKLDLEAEASHPANSLERGNVIYLSTFSKTLAPGLRLGWVIAPAEVITRLVQLKQAADLHTSTFVQQLVFETARSGFLDSHIRGLRAAYRERRDVMLAALAAEMPLGASWTHPAGGLFVWLKLPEGMDCEALLQRALERDVAFVPGTAFFAERAQGERYCRLNFSNTPPDRIREGIQRLAGVLETKALEPELA
ncbi:MAG: PLP-dependent aminotransferase family protein [Anaerolineales bacterium]